MTFVKGVSGNPSGRPKGARDKLNRKVDEKLAELGCDPILGLGRIGMKAEEEGDLALAARCYSDLAQYIAPKRRSVEIVPPAQIDEARLEQIHDLFMDMRGAMSAAQVLVLPEGQE